MEDLEGFLEELSALSEKYGLYINCGGGECEGPYVSKISDGCDVGRFLLFEAGKRKKPGRYTIDAW
jgi:hypothetical protein